MKKYAVVVGVSTYEDPEISNLNFAAEDAQDMGLALVDLCGFDGVQVLRSGGAVEPEHARVVDAIRSFAPEVNEEDLFVFFFAGHGLHLDGRGYLLTQGARMHMPELTSLPLDALQKSLSMLECRHRVLILDACRNDPRHGMGDDHNLLTDDFSRDLQMLGQAKATGTAPSTCMLFSCNIGQRAWEWPEKGHGVFTHYLLEGLRSGTDAEKPLTVQRLSAYVEQRVCDWSRKRQMPRPQTPWSQQFGSLREIVLRSLENHSDNVSISCPPPLGRVNVVPAKLHISTTPPGAQITVNERPMGDSPIAIPLGRGEHTISAALEGHVTWRHQVNFDGIGNANLPIVLDSKTHQQESAIAIRKRALTKEDTREDPADRENGVGFSHDHSAPHTGLLRQKIGFLANIEKLSVAGIAASSCKNFESFQRKAGVVNSGCGSTIGCFTFMSGFLTIGAFTSSLFEGSIMIALTIFLLCLTLVFAFRTRWTLKKVFIEKLERLETLRAFNEVRMLTENERKELHDLERLLKSATEELANSINWKNEVLGVETYDLAIQILNRK